MGLGDGAVVGTSLIVDHGPPTDRWNLVIVGDGYRQAELAQFATNAQDVVTALFAAPPFSDPGGLLFPPLTSAINVYRVDVRSTDSGADDPAACGGSGATAATGATIVEATGATGVVSVADGATIVAGAVMVGRRAAMRGSRANMTARAATRAMSIPARRATIPTIPAGVRAIVPAPMSNGVGAPSAAKTRLGP